MNRSCIVLYLIVLHVSGELLLLLLLNVIVAMDFIRKYDIELEKEYYYAGEVVRGCVALENLESLRVNGKYGLYDFRAKI